MKYWTKENGNKLINRLNQIMEKSYKDKEHYSPDELAIHDKAQDIREKIKYQFYNRGEIHLTDEQYDEMREAFDYLEAWSRYTYLDYA